MTDPTAKAVLVALADHVDARWQCWPSVARLCDFTALSERAVQGALKRLASMGAIRVQYENGHSSIYLIDRSWPGQPDISPPQQVHPLDAVDTPAAGAPPPPQQVHPTPAAGAPTPAAGAPEPSITIIEPEFEPLGHKNGREKKKKASMTDREFIAEITDAGEMPFRDAVSLLAKARTPGLAHDADRLACASLASKLRVSWSPHD